MGSGYQRQLGTLDAVMVVVGAIIGGGIYLNPPLVAKHTGSFTLSLSLWVLGGLITVAGGFCFAELGSRMPEAGGSYVYLREAFGRLPAFLQGWALMFVNGPGSVAFNAALCAKFFHFGSGCPESWQVPVGLAAIALLTLVNYVGVRPGATTQNVLTTLKIGVLLLLAFAGLSGMGTAHTAPPPAPPSDPSWSDLGAAMVAVIFAYNGWQVVSFLAGEIDDASRRLPRAIVGGIFGTMTVYLLANLAYVRALGFSGLAATELPAPPIMVNAFGEIGGKIMTWGVVVSTLGFLNVAILTVPRAFQTMAADGLFFTSIGRIHERWRTPANAIVLQSIVASLLLLSNKFEELLAMVAFADATFLGLAAAALIRIRARDAAADPAVFRAPAHPLMPVFYMVACAGLVASSIAASPFKAGGGALLIVLGVPIYAYWERQAKP